MAVHGRGESRGTVVIVVGPVGDEVDGVDGGAASVLHGEGDEAGVGGAAEGGDGGKGVLQVVGTDVVDADGEVGLAGTPDGVAGEDLADARYLDGVVGLGHVAEADLIVFPN